MCHSIGDVAKTTGIAISTLRYYDREGMFPDMERSSGGIRIFSDKEIGTIRVIECLKKAGMSIKGIKEFLGWCQEGDASLKQRQNMFHARLEEVEQQMEDLQRTMNTLKFKCWYYDTAIAAGGEAAVRAIPVDEIPEEIREHRI